MSITMNKFLTIVRFSVVLALTSAVDGKSLTFYCGEGGDGICGGRDKSVIYFCAEQARDLALDEFPQFRSPKKKLLYDPNGFDPSSYNGQRLQYLFDSETNSLNNQEARANRKKALGDVTTVANGGRNLESSGNTFSGNDEVFDLELLNTQMEELTSKTTAAERRLVPKICNQCCVCECCALLSICDEFDYSCRRRELDSSEYDFGRNLREENAYRKLAEDGFLSCLEDRGNPCDVYIDSCGAL